MPTFDAGESGLVGTVGLTILHADGTLHAARRTAGITEPVDGSGVYYAADAGPGLALTYVWDVGAGGICGSETPHMLAVSAGAFAYTVTDSTTGLPIASVYVFATTDEAGTNVVSAAYTDDFGVVHLPLDAGTWYLWRRKAGYQFDNPDVETIPA